VLAARALRGWLRPEVIRPAVLAICTVAAVALLAETF
jgi:hypothetical protein